MGDELVIKCRGLVKGQAEGEALVAATTLSFWGEVDPVSGRVIASGHPLEGQCLGGKVLVIKSTKGSSATPLVIGLARQQGNAPLAFVNTEVDALAVLGCVVNRIPMVAVPPAAGDAVPPAAGDAVPPAGSLRYNRNGRSSPSRCGSRNHPGHEEAS